jgi:spore germination protein KB
MNSGGRIIGVHQFTILVIFFGVGSSILIAPSMLAAVARQDAWLASLIGQFESLFLVAIYIALARRYPRRSWIEINELVFGKWIGKAISLQYLIYFFLLGTLLAGDIGYFLTTQIMPETPILFIMGCLMVIVVMAVRLGPETMARGAEIFFPWVILLFLTLVLMLLPKMEMEKMLPMMEYGYSPVLRASVPYVSLQEYVVLMMIYPFVKTSKKIVPAFYVGVVTTGIVLVIIMLLCIVVLGPGLTASNIYPSFTLAKKISIGKFLERVEVIIGGLWFITITFKLILTFFATAAGASQTFRFRSYSFLTVPLAMLTVASVLPSYTNVVYATDFIHRVWPAYSLTFLLALPLATLLVSLWRKKPAQYAPPDSP